MAPKSPKRRPQLTLNGVRFVHGARGRAARPGDKIVLIQSALQHSILKALSSAFNASRSLALCQPYPKEGAQFPKTTPAAHFERRAVCPWCAFQGGSALGATALFSAAVAAASGGLLVVQVVQVGTGITTYERLRPSSRRGRAGRRKPANGGWDGGGDGACDDRPHTTRPHHRPRCALLRGLWGLPVGTCCRNWRRFLTAPWASPRVADAAPTSCCCCYAYASAAMRVPLLHRPL